MGKTPKKTPILGRPPKPAAEKQANRLVIKLTPAERADIDAAGGGATSTWAREVLLRAARRS